MYEIFINSSETYNNLYKERHKSIVLMPFVEYFSNKEILERFNTSINFIEILKNNIIKNGYNHI